MEPNQAAMIAAVRMAGDMVGEEREKGFPVEEEEE